jgi:3-phosphoshikimate 1-carboxyvinyltransferase
MDFLAIPPAKEVRGEIDAPPSKSGTNRALVLAALSETPVELVRPLVSEDTLALRRCLDAMGASIEECAVGLRVHGPLRGPAQGEAVLDAGESGTAARLLVALAAVTPGRFLITGSARLRERPIRELVEALSPVGARIESRGAPGFLPLAVAGRSVEGGRLRVDASRSSQFLSALLLAGAAASGEWEVEVAGEIASPPYVRLTVEALRAFGHHVDEGSRFRIGRGDHRVGRYEISGDFSSAIPIFAAAGAAGGSVTVLGLPWPAADADARALPVLEAMGLSVAASAGRISAASFGSLRPARVRASDFPDAVPALAALAGLAEGESRFEGIAHLRWKESDRIDALARLLTEAGGSARAEEEALVVSGPISASNGRARRLPTFNDHRIAMAAALLSLAVPGLLVENPGCVAKSYPGFFRDLERIVLR